MGPRYAALASTIPVEPFSPPFHLTFHRFLLERFPLIKELFSLRKSEVHFDFSIGKVELDRNQRVSPLLDFSNQAFDLSFVEEEFSRPQRIMIQPVRLGIRTDMRVDQKDFAPFDIAVTIPEVHPSVPQGFDLGPEEGDPGLVSLLNEVVMKCLPILANHLFAHLSTSCMEHSAIIAAGTT
jgi:hypothetical protein